MFLPLRALITIANSIQTVVGFNYLRQHLEERLLKKRDDFT